MAIPLSGEETAQGSDQASQPTSRAYAFIDGQNFLGSVRECFGHRDPLLDVRYLIQRVCEVHGWTCVGVGFYTGIHRREKNPHLHDEWTRALSYMGRRGAEIWTRPLAYHTKTLRCRDCDEPLTCSCGGSATWEQPREKGVDVRIALDALSLALDQAFDLAIFVSSDQDLFEVVLELRKLGQGLGHQLDVASAYPEGTPNGGIRGTIHVPISKVIFEECLPSQRKRSPRSRSRSSNRDRIA